jgi:hypothetical protein
MKNMYDVGEYNDVECEGEEVTNAIGIKHLNRDEIWN